MVRYRTFEVQYNFFPPGTRVRASSGRCPLQQDRVYEVRECYEPLCPGDECIVAVWNEPYGVSAEYLEEVPEGE